MLLFDSTPSFQIVTLLIRAGLSAAYTEYPSMSRVTVLLSRHASWAFQCGLGRMTQPNANECAVADLYGPRVGSMRAPIFTGS